MLVNNLISLTSVSSNVRLERFRTEDELARNFYDDYEFCPVHNQDEVTEHRERVQRRTSPQPSPNYIAPCNQPSYYVSPKPQQYYSPYIHHTPSSSSSSTTTKSSTLITKAIPIIDPTNMIPVAVPIQQKQQSWMTYQTSPTSSSSSPNSSTDTDSSSTDYSFDAYYPQFSSSHDPYFHRQQQTRPFVARAIPIVDPVTRETFHYQQQSSTMTSGFYNVLSI
ncbi:MAG: hypothetical protein EXX96DRAFT_580628 [Benjaminiella poitrasii]|nr:MAG: hypothetical protein EXX96DRAFT_580628 [Benjaminiella poitrasii]